MEIPERKRCFADGDTAEVRTPISAPLVGTRAGILAVAVGNGLSGEIGSSLCVAPRASLL
jgi:hypothetical protein